MGKGCSGHIKYRRGHAPLNLKRNYPHRTNLLADKMNKKLLVQFSVH